MASYEFGSTLYRTRTQMLDGIAREWLTAGGANCAETIREMVAEGMDATSAAAEAIKGWGLDEADDDRPSHMAEHDYTADDLAEAMERAIAEYRAAA